MTVKAHFTPALFDFLRELRANNDREWFQRNKARYESDVRAPALRFVADAGEGLHKISRHVVADPRPVGGSLFRINRDIRFSADKSPYKTAVGMSFGHDRGREGAAPGYYLHLEPGDSFAGGGVHMPDTPTLTRIRDAIVADTRGWGRVVGDPAFAPMFTSMGEVLKRAPQGYDANHPYVEHLKRKSMTWHVMFSERAVCAPDFMERFLDSCRTAAPFTRFLARALGAAW
jgi:uncharacterized protein (TIGR02453 family)